MSFRLFGIDIIIHWSFFLIVFAISFPVLTKGALIYSLLSFIGAFLVLVFSIGGHEIAHSITARYLGYETRDIIIHFLGGAAVIKNITNIKDHAIICFAGPLFNFAVASLVFLLFNLTDNPGLDESFVAMINLLFVVNVIMAVFNMIPAYPMDGGIIFKYVAGLLYGKEKADLITHKAGTAFAILFAVISVIIFNPILFIIAIYIWYMNGGVNYGRRKP